MKTQQRLRLLVKRARHATFLYNELVEGIGPMKDHYIRTINGLKRKGNRLLLERWMSDLPQDLRASHPDCNVCAFLWKFYRIVDDEEHDKLSEKYG